MFAVMEMMILKKFEKNGEITEDELRGYSEDIQKLTDQSYRKNRCNCKRKRKRNFRSLDYLLYRTFHFIAIIF